MHRLSTIARGAFEGKVWIGGFGHSDCQQRDWLSWDRNIFQVVEADSPVEPGYDAFGGRAWDAYAGRA
jgi:hypothetical protein